jgi:ketosteroid isomerase-like protein
MKPLARSLTCLVLASACSSVPQVATPDQRDTIDRIRRQTEAAENAASVDRMRVHFTPDIVMLAPNMPAVAGADSVAHAMRAFFDAFDVQIQYTSQEILVMGTWAFDRGTYRHTLTPRRGGTPLKETGKYLWLYRRMPDGSWKQARVIWNGSDAPPGGA